MNNAIFAARAACGIALTAMSLSVVAQPQSPSRPVQAPQAQRLPPPTVAPASAVSAQAGDVPRSTYIQMMDSDYRKRDLDGDGRVTRAEVEQFERSILVEAAQSKNKALFASLDADRSGTLTPGEFAGLVGNIAPPDVSALMARFDTNRDQVISIIEYRAATLINFDRLDADKDGIVTELELKAARAPQVPEGR